MLQHHTQCPSQCLNNRHDECSQCTDGSLLVPFAHQHAHPTPLQLLEAISTLDRGVKATVEDRELVDGLAAQLEKLNPTPKPLASPLLNGRWRLLYTTSPTVLGLNKPPFFRPSGPIYQVRLLGNPGQWPPRAACQVASKARGPQSAL